MVPKPKKDFTKAKTKFQSRLDDELSSTQAQEQPQASNTAENHLPTHLRRKPTRQRRRNRRELERKVLSEWNSTLSYPQRHNSYVSTAFRSKWQAQVAGSCQQNDPVQQENIQPPSIEQFHREFYPQVSRLPGSHQPMQPDYCLAHVHTFQATQLLSQWNHHGQSSHSLLTIGQQYRNWYFSSGNHALQLQEVEQTVQQNQIYCAGRQ